MPEVKTVVAAEEKTVVAAEEEEEEEDVKIWLGVPAGPQSKAERQDALETKLGGQPVWPQPETPERAAAAAKFRELAVCGVCGDPMYLLLQAFCPKDTLGRILFVCCCNSSKCQAANPSKAWRALRYQEPGLQPEDEEEEEEEEEEDEEDAEEQVPPGCFPAIALEVVEEPSEEEFDEVKQRRAMDDLNQRLKEKGDAISTEEAMAMEDSGMANRTDPQLADFQARMHKCPQQAVRWGYGGKPLWISSNSQVREEDVPPSACGAARRFELQIMPTVVWHVRADKHLKPGRELGDEGVDFGTATVYTCSRGDGHAQGLFEDHIHVQPPPRD